MSIIEYLHKIGEILIRFWSFDWIPPLVTYVRHAYGIPCFMGNFDVTYTNYYFLDMAVINKEQISM